MSARRRLARSLAIVALCAPSARVFASGVEVVDVVPGLASRAAGLRPGDRLLGWSQAGETGPLASPFDVLELEAERGPRGPVSLDVRREDQALHLELFPDDWGLDVRPELAPDLAAMHDEARRRAAAGEVDAAVQRLRGLEARLAGAKAEARCWALLEIAKLERRRRGADATTQAMRDAIAHARGAGVPLLSSRLLEVLGQSLIEMERFEEAVSVLGEALALRPDGDPPSLARAAIQEKLMTAAYLRGKGMEEARPALQDALARQERLAPRSLAVVRTMLALGPVLDSEQEALALFERALAIVRELAPESLLEARGLQLMSTVTPHPPRKLELSRQALAIREKRAPGSVEVASSLRQLAIQLNQVGQPVEAEEHLQRALALQELIAPGTQQHGRILNGLSQLAKDRGDLALAESYHRRFLTLTERLQPDSIWLAIAYLNLGGLLNDRRQFDEAETYLARAWDIARREGPRSDVAAYILMTRGVVARARGDAAAREHLDAALALLREIEPRSAIIPDVLQDLGDMARDRGRLDDAQAHYEQALAAAVRRAPESGSAAKANESMGALASRRGALETAEKHHRAALDLRRAVAPDSIWEAESSHSLGLVLYRSGRRAEGVELLRRAVAALEAQGRRLGGSAEARAHFRAHYAEYYRDLEAALLEMGRDAEAFETVERSRARSLLGLLAARDLRFARDTSPETEAERRSADASYDRLLRRLSAPRAPLTETARAALLEELERARRRQDDVRARIRSVAPRLAAIRDPEPLDLAGVRRVLGPGTLLLAYSLGPSASRVYAVGPGADDFRVHPLLATEPELRAAVERFRERIGRTRGTLGRRALEDAAARLGDLLLGPAADQMGRAERLLVIPDGVLHSAPLSALRIGDRFLVELLPLQVIPSVTLSSELARRAAQRGEPTHVEGFGDPAYPPTAADGAPARSGVLGTLRLDPLPAGRRELKALAGVSPASARLWLGADATEERAKALDRGARIVHFATHGFVDDVLPLESGLVLSIPAGVEEGAADNGLLQAWEVFEQVRLDADLVTLSACQTGLGQEVGGDGLLGLIWAFQYAGARSVLASLWAVNDDSTADLMERFYRHLRAGRPKDASLRQAQLELLRRPATSAPFFWAPFQISGDWR